MAQEGSCSSKKTHTATAGFDGDGATAFPAEAAGMDLHGEHLSDFKDQGTAQEPGTAGFGGGGATAFPAQASKQAPKGEHLSDIKEVSKS